ncbi:MAG: hypothetical protein ACOVQG_11095, partial [Crocinitomicaceae bacterium]
MKHFVKYFSLVTILLQGFFAFSSGNCTNTTAFGTATAPTNTSAVTISTCNYQTEYSTINSIVAGNTYVLTNSCGGYITVHSGSNSGTVVAQGNSPLTFTATTSGTYYPSWNTSSNCGTASNCCTTTIQCTSCGGSGTTGCANTSSFGTATAPTSNTTTTISSCNYQTEYSTINSIVAGNTYSLNSSCGGFVTIHSGANNGPVVASGNAPLSWTATTSGTYYVSWNTNSSCGTATNCCTTTITCTSCSGGGGGGGGGSGGCVSLNGNSNCNAADPFC